VLQAGGDERSEPLSGPLGLPENQKERTAMATQENRGTVLEEQVKTQKQIPLVRNQNFLSKQSGCPASPKGCVRTSQNLQRGRAARL
jgi:hypothetical protein